MPEDTPPTCRVCGNPIDPGDNVVFTSVFGDVETVHLRCAPKTRRKRSERKPGDSTGEPNAEATA